MVNSQKLTIFFTDYYYHSVQNSDDDSELKYSDMPLYTGRQTNFQLQNNQSQDSQQMVQNIERSDWLVQSHGGQERGGDIQHLGCGDTP